LSRVFSSFSYYGIVDGSIYVYQKKDGSLALLCLVLFFCSFMGRRWSGRCVLGSLKKAKTRYLGLQSSKLFSPQYVLVAGLFKKSWARLDRAGNWIHGQSLVLLNSYF
jgi:hypothetical protein